MPFELNAPLGLWLGALVGPLLLLYVLRSRRRRVVVSSVALWRAATRDLEARRPLRRLVAQVPLALEIACLLLLALALADPRARQAGTPGETVALVVDVSASMGARGADGGTRLARAIDEARGVVDGLLPGSSAWVIAAGQTPRVASAIETDRGRLRAALDMLEVRHEGGDLDAALALALDRLTARGGPGRVLLLSDGGSPLAPRESRIPVTLRSVGEPIDNVGIVRSDVRAAAAGALRLEVFLAIQSAATRTAERFVTLRRKGSPDLLASRRLQIAPGATEIVTLTYDSLPGDAGTGLLVELSPPDALDADDRAHLVVPTGRALPVRLEGPGDPTWVARALTADPDVVIASGGEAPPGALRVLLGTCDEEDRPGDVLVIHPPPGPCLGFEVRPESAAATVTSWDRHDPRLRFVDLEGASFPGPRPLAGGARGAGLVRGGSLDLIGRADEDRGHRTVVSFDLARSRWPLSADFVVFVRNVADLARQTRSQLLGLSTRSGEPLRLPVPRSARAIVLEDPEGRPTPLEAHDGLALAPAPGQTGFHFLHWQGPAAGSKLLGVNLSSPSESDTRGRHEADSAEPVAGRLAPEPAQPARVTRLGWGLALVAGLLALLDAAWVARGRPRPSLRTIVRRPVWVAFLSLAALVSLFGLAAWLGLCGSDGLLRFARPALTLLAVPALGLAAVLVGRAAARWSRARRVLTEVTVGTAVLGAVFAAADPEIGLSLERVAVVVAVDRSRSMDLVPGVASRLRAELQVAELGMREHDAIARVGFGAEARLEDPLRPRSRLPSPQRVETGRDATDLEAALRRALAEIPSDAAGRVALLSDGVATRGDALAAAVVARVAGVPIDVVPLDQAPASNLRVNDVRAPSTVALDAPVEIRVVTEAPRAMEVEVRLYRNGELVRSGTTPVAAGEDVLWLRDRASEPGLARYEVRVTALEPDLDSIADDNRGTTFVRVHGAERALVIAPPGAPPPITGVLRHIGMHAEVASPDAVPADAAGFAAYDLVVLADVPAAQVAPAQLDALATYVEHGGGGLLLLGGPSAFGPGGYARTSIERVSPVSFDLKQDRRRGTLAEVIAIDYSGSMSASAGAHTKLELANEGAVRSAALLGSGDRVGVMHVDTAVRWTVAMGEPSRPALEKQIRAVGPGGGGIYVDLALREAYRALDGERTSLRHVLLFSDGADAEERSEAPHLVAAAARRGVTTSVVALGRGDDVPALEQLSRLGNGRFYVIEHAGRLPAVFAQETITATRSALVEEPFVPAPEHRPTYASGIDWTSAPPLGGYVVTLARPRSDVALTGPDGDPVLASWSVGLGRVAAFTSDYGSRWGVPWLDWPGAAQLFAQLGRFLARSLGVPTIDLRAEARDGRLAVHVRDLTAHETSRHLEVVIGDPNGGNQRLPLEPTSAGVYSADLPLSRSGTYLVTAVDARSGAPLGTTAAMLERSEELRPTGTDRPGLARIAARSGGRVRDTLAGIFEEREGRRRAYTPLLPWLVTLAGFALLLSVAARRLVIPDAVLDLPSRTRRVIQRFFPASTPPPARGDTPAGATAAALLRSKGRARGRETPALAEPAADTLDEATAVPLVVDTEAPGAEPAAGAGPPDAPPADGAEASLSAAEILAQRKRRR
jgi:Ca-activated chloride channel homolog